MTVEMTYLLLSVVLTLVLAVIAVTGAVLAVGLPTRVGNRENSPEFTGWAGRVTRAHRNMLESLVLFAVAIIVAKLVNVSNAMTVHAVLFAEDV